MTKIMKTTGWTALLVVLGAIQAFAQAAAPAPDPMAMLLSGNERYISGKVSEKKYLSDRAAVVDGQHPYAIILTCADSRVPPEAIFDETLGKLFVVRVAGNVVDPVVLGSIEYAVEHLNAKLLVVMGHASCGAVKAAVGHGEFPPNISKILQRIQPAVDKVRISEKDENKLLDAVIRENARYQARMATFESDVLNEMVKEHKLAIVSAVYSLKTGKVDFIDSPRGEMEMAPAAKESGKPEASTPKEKSTPAKSHPDKAGHKGDEEQQSALPSFSMPEMPRAPMLFSERLRLAYKDNSNVLLKANVIMKDSRDRCLAGDCPRLMAGNMLKIESPLVVEVMGTPSIKVKAGRKSFYMPADENALDFDAPYLMERENPQGLLVRVLTSPARLRDYALSLKY